MLQGGEFIGPPCENQTSRFCTSKSLLADSEVIEIPQVKLRLSKSGIDGQSGSS
jgi:hypothetical protein